MSISLTTANACSRLAALDKDSQGLIFLTNHGDLVNKILRAGNDHEKEYLVTVDKPITDEFIRGMGAGVPILGTVTKKCKVKKEAPFVFRITPGAGAEPSDPAHVRAFRL